MSGACASKRASPRCRPRPRAPIASSGHSFASVSRKLGAQHRLVLGDDGGWNAHPVSPVSRIGHADHNLRLPAPGAIDATRLARRLPMGRGCDECGVFGSGSGE